MQPLPTRPHCRPVPPVSHWARVALARRLPCSQRARRCLSAWWANYTATRPADYQVSWAEFCNAFCTHYIPAGVMRKKRHEFMDLKQGGRSVHDYSKQFNHLAQYAPNQVHTNEKKNDRFMISLSTKLQERLVLNTGGTFPEFESNVMIADDVIRAQKETKKKKVVATPSGSAPPKYRTVYHHSSTYPPQ
jgi:hypothetical protein